MEPLHIIVIVAALVVAALLAYLHHLAEKKRRAALAAVAAVLEFDFDPGRDYGHDHLYAHFEIFRRGHGRAAFNTLAGMLETRGGRCPVKMGDFVYKVTRHTGRSSRTRTYRFSYLILHLPWTGLPDLLIRRERVLDKLAGAFGLDDIDFESAQFSRRYHVKSPDKRFAYDVIDPRMMEFLLSTEPPCVDIEHGRVCLADGRTRWDPQEFQSRLQWVARFLDHWPEHVVRGRDEGTKGQKG